MWTHWMTRWIAVGLLVLAAPSAALAQTLGTFRWQLQPYCNVVTLTVIANGGAYTLDGFDDQCGAAQRASAAGTAFLNPDGSIGVGLNIVTAPEGTPLHVDIALNLATVGGPWRDSGGGSGTFVFNPVSVSGTPRPAPAAVFTAGLLAGSTIFRPDGSFVAPGDTGGPPPATGAGSRLMWYAGRSAFRAGEVDTGYWDPEMVGEKSVAFGFNAIARGAYSFAVGWNSRAEEKNAIAMGSAAVASGQHSVAMGFGATASGLYGTALGPGARASGEASVALGGSTVASGTFSTATGFISNASGGVSVAMGYNATASGHRSVALGSNASTNSFQGAFVFGDMSTGSITSSAINQFTVRAAGGTRFFSNAGLTAGVTLAAGGGAWASVSDVNMKEHFRDLDGDDVLTKVARMPIREWSYKSQDASVRHVGPTAQDFYAAFGLGEDPLKITTIDADGIALRAIQALLAEIAQLRERLDRLESTHFRRSRQ